MIAFLRDKQKTSQSFWTACAKILIMNQKEFIEDVIKQPLKVGQVNLNNRLALAPLAGTTEVVFRSLISQLGAGLVTTELVSARGICYDPSLKKNYQYLEIDPLAEKATAIQLFGHDPEDFRKASRIILDHPILSQCAMIDINMGCPVKKVVKEGAGSALMKDPDRAVRIVEAVVREAAPSGKPVSVKFRSGWDEETLNAPAFGRQMVAAGASLITVHARTRKQMYSGQADWEVIREVVQEVDVPVYGNGDLVSLESLEQMFELTACAGFAIGRAAQANPWIFRELLGGLPVRDKAEWLSLIEQHVDGRISRERSEEQAIIQLRGQFSAYLKGKRNGASLRRELMACKSKGELFTILDQVAL